jgi:hypothetical protein
MYIILIEDHHTDTDAEAYANRDTALQRAQALLDGYSDNTAPQGGEPLTPEMVQQGWIFFGLYGESDGIRVIERTLTY